MSQAGTGRYSARFQRLHGRRGNRKAPLLHRSHHNIALKPFFSRQGAANQSQQFGIADHFDQGPAFAARRIAVQDFRERAVGENQPFLRVDHPHAFHHAAQNRARTVALAAERADRAIHPRRRFIQRLGEFREFVARSFGGQGTEIALGQPQRKAFEPLHTFRERPEEKKQSDRAAARMTMVASSNRRRRSAKRRIHLRERQVPAESLPAKRPEADIALRGTQYPGAALRRAGSIGLLPTRRLALISGRSDGFPRPAGHPEDSTSTRPAAINHRDTGAASGQPTGPGAKFFGVVETGRLRGCDIRKRREAG